MDHSLSGRRGPARQTTEKVILYACILAGRPALVCTRQMAHRYCFLSRQNDVMASFSFGAWCVHTEISALKILYY